ncbi:MAG: hypothetical protein ACI9NY_000666 [Kiritimatiellia bacterium]|jgi:hypothetical protein
MLKLCLAYISVVIFSSALANVTLAGEVDVLNVEVQSTGADRYHIAVTVQHDDTGWDHYSNAWEVLDEKGALMGVRVLHHPHVNEQPFTRSLTITIPSAVKKITLRGKDSIHAYGGKVVEVEMPPSL